MVKDFGFPCPRGNPWFLGAERPQRECMHSLTAARSQFPAGDAPAEADILGKSPPRCQRTLCPRVPGVGPFLLAADVAVPGLEAADPSF